MHGETFVFLRAFSVILCGSTHSISIIAPAYNTLSSILLCFRGLPPLHPLKDDRDQIQREQRAGDHPAHQRQGQRLAEGVAVAEWNEHGNKPKDSGQAGHDHRTEAVQARLPDRLVEVAGLVQVASHKIDLKDGIVDGNTC